MTVPNAAGARAVVATLALAATVTLAGCNDDGRVLRPARPDQNASVSTIAAPTTVDSAFDQVGAGEVTTLPLVTVPGSTLPGSTLPGSTLPGYTLPGQDALILTAPFDDGAPIDVRFSCDGENLSPALSWSGAPAGTVEIAISMTDTDAGGFVHWVLAGLGPTITRLGEAEVLDGAILATNGEGTQGYTGPCPPAGDPAHRYVFTVHFLSQATELSTGVSGDDLLAFVQGATFDGASTVGTFARG